MQVKQIIYTDLLCIYICMYLEIYDYANKKKRGGQKRLEPQERGQKPHKLHMPSKMRVSLLEFVEGTVFMNHHIS
jgi:hypothetical protein